MVRLRFKMPIEEDLMTVEQKARQLFEANPHYAMTWADAVTFPPMADTVQSFRDQARRALMAGN